MKLLWKALKIGALILGSGAFLIALAVGWYFYRTPNPAWRTSSLSQALADPNMYPRGRWYAAVALKSRGRPAMLQALPAMIASDTPLVQDLIPDFLLTLEGDAVPALLGSLQSQSADERQAAAFWLGAMARACDLKAPDGILMESRPGHGAAEGTMASPDGCEGWHPAVDRKLSSAVPALTAALNDSDPAVRQEAAKALKSIQTPRSSKS